jgi:metallo-beta-lactamase family protein
MKIQFLGAARMVTGSCHHVIMDTARFLIDCGLYQGGKAIKELNYNDFEIPPNSVEFMILTHAHIDHAGLIPKLVKHGFKGPIYCTQGTAELVNIMLPDSAHIQVSEVERKNRKNQRLGLPEIEPIYTVEDAMTSLNQLQIVALDQHYTPAPGVDFCLRDAGHILGSAMVELWLTEGGETQKVVFSGDLGQMNQPLINNPTQIESADWVVMESTYGNRIHNQGLNRRGQLQAVIDETMKKGGNLIIPAFAVERTQDLLYDLHMLWREQKLDSSIDIIIDSPLAVAATEVFHKSVQYYDEESLHLLAHGDHPLEMPNLRFSRTQQDSMAINQLAPGKRIIISASGMCDAGRIKHHLKHNLWRPESTVLFVGYQAEGSLGRRILDGEPTVRIHGEEVNVLADIRVIEAFSSHADQAALLSWLQGFKEKPRQVFLVHGEENSQQVLAGLIEEQLQIPVVIPAWLDKATLDPAAGVSVPLAAVAPQISFEQRLYLEEIYVEIQRKLHQAIIEEPAGLLEKLQAIDEMLSPR